MKHIIWILAIFIVGCSKDELIVNPISDIDDSVEVVSPPYEEFKIYPSSFETHEFNKGYYSYHTTPLPDNGMLVVGLTYVDFNKDGYVDILGKDENDPSKIKLYTNDGFGNYNVSEIQATNESVVSLRNGPRKIITADFNNDGNLDIVLGLAPDDETSVRGLYLLENRGSQFYEHTILNGDRDWIHAVTAADINGDGNIDLFPGGKGYVLMGNGDFTFIKKDLPRVMTFEDPMAPGEYGSRGVSQEMIDINGDGFVDVLMGYHLNDVDYIGQDYANSHVIHFGTGDENLFTEAYVLQSNYQGTNITLDFSVYDFDNDGDLDLFTNSSFNYQGKYVIQYYENNGYMNFTNKSSEVFQDESNLVTNHYDIDWIKFIDMNDDGIEELMIEGPNFSIVNGQYNNPSFNGFTLNENGKFIRKMF